jgi:hypothetical protein
VDEFNFDTLAPIEVPVKIAGRNYVLREATGEAAGKYRAASLRGAEITHDDETGQRTIKRLESAADVEPLLVSLCLFDVTDGERTVSIETVKAWPARVQRALFEKAKEISQLDEADDLAALERQAARLQARIERAKNAKNS